MYLNLKRYEMKTSNQDLRMYMVHKPIMTLLDILGLIQLIQVTNF